MPFELYENPTKAEEIVQAVLLFKVIMQQAV